MNDELTNEAYEALSKYRQERAHETLEEIPFLREKGYYGTAINRLYYACYYAALAMLAKHHIASSTHSGVKTLLGLHFVSKGWSPRRAAAHSRTCTTADNEETTMNLYMPHWKRLTNFTRKRRNSLVKSTLCWRNRPHNPIFAP